MPLIRSIPPLEALRNEWQALAVPFATPLLEPDWLLTCARTLHRENDLRVVTVHRDGELVGVAPLVLQATPAGRRLTLLGADTLHEPSGLIYRDEQALAALTREIIAIGVPVVLARLANGPQLLGHVNSLLRDRTLAVSRMTQPSLGVELSGSWNEYWQRLSRRTRSDLTRIAARAQRDHGEIRAETVYPDNESVHAIFDEFVELEDSGWKGRQRSSLRHRSAARDFFQQYSAHAAQARTLRVTRVCFGHELAAMELALRAHGRVWGLKIGFDERFAAVSPGLQLVRASMHAAFEEGAHSFEFLGSAEDWERRWRPTERAHHLLALYPLTGAGLFGAGRDVGLALGRRWKVARRVG